MVVVVVVVVVVVAVVVVVVVVDGCFTHYSKLAKPWILVEMQP
jgi:hypothetical protein